MPALKEYGTQDTSAQTYEELLLDAASAKLARALKKENPGISLTTTWSNETARNIRVEVPGKGVKTIKLECVQPPLGPYEAGPAAVVKGSYIKGFQNAVRHEDKVMAHGIRMLSGGKLYGGGVHNFSDQFARDLLDPSAEIF